MNYKRFDNGDFFSISLRTFFAMRSAVIGEVHVPYGAVVVVGTAMVQCSYHLARTIRTVAAER